MSEENEKSTVMKTETVNPITINYGFSVNLLSGGLVAEFCEGIGFENGFRFWADSDSDQFPDADRQCRDSAEHCLIVDRKTGEAYQVSSKEASIAVYE